MSALLGGTPDGEVERLKAEVNALRLAAQRPLDVDDVARALEVELDAVKGRARALEARRRELEARRDALRAEFDATVRSQRARPVLRAAGALLGVVAGAAGFIAGWPQLGAALGEQSSSLGVALLAVAPVLTFAGARALRRSQREATGP